MTKVYCITEITHIHTYYSSSLHKYSINYFVMSRLFCKELLTLRRKITEVQVFCGLSGIKYSMAVTAGGQSDMEQNPY